MKYRIIEERDGNGDCHYEAEIWTEGWFRDKWEPLVTYSQDFQVRRVIKFSTFERAKSAVMERSRSRVTVEEAFIT